MSRTPVDRVSVFLQRYRRITACVAGALTPLTLAPFDYWPVGILTVAIFALVVHEQTHRETLWIASLFGIGLFGTGASWVYVSIHDYGYAPVPLAALLTIVFCAGLGFVFALPFYLYRRCFDTQLLSLSLVFPALWVGGEWLRSWLLTGFPWLYLGYGHLSSPLAGWFPVTGIFGVSFIMVFSSASLTAWLLHRNLNPLLFALALFFTGHALKQVQWTHIDYDSPITVGIVQPDFALEDKWNPAKRELIRSTMQGMSQTLWGHHIILWPEAALSELYQDAEDFLEPLDHLGKQTKTTLITGIPYLDTAASTGDGRHIYYNSITALGNGEGLYHKVRLVPFGEYVPLEAWLRGIIRFLDLPMSDFSRGAEQQAALRAGSSRVASFICYEVVYPDLVARNARNTDWLVTISNDSWFGASLGPRQHLEMAQARALETGRFMLRGTNNGISAIIDPAGRIQNASRQFTPDILEGTIFPATGETPYMQFGNLPLLMLLGSLLTGCFWHQRKGRNPL